MTLLRKATVGGVLLALAACGVEEKKKPESVNDYYVEEGDFDGNSPVDQNHVKSSDATGSGGSGDLHLTFVSPVADLDSAGKVDIELEFKDVDASATWTLFYAMTQDAIDGVEIVSAVPVSQTKVSWDTSALASGTYYLYAELMLGQAKYRHNADVAVTVKDGQASTPGNTKPTVKLDFPVGEEVFVAGTAQAVKFTGADADSDALTYKVEFSPDGGATWTTAADKLTTPSYDWDVAGLKQGINYRVRVTADDGKGGTAQATSPKAFGVAAEAMTFSAGFGKMLQNKCGGCHAMGATNAANFTSDNFDLATIGVNDKQINIKGRIEANTMPPAAPLGADDKAILTLWIWSGAQ